MTATADRWTRIIRERERLLRLSRARLNDSYEAEDVVQEAMLRCAEFDNLDEERLSAFLTAVTIRLCADLHRQRERHERLGHRLATWSNVPAPEDDICDRAEAVWLARALDSKLNKNESVTLQQRSEGASLPEISRRNDLSYATAANALHTARRKARALLKRSWQMTSDPRGARAS